MKKGILVAGVLLVVAGCKKVVSVELPGRPRRSGHRGGGYECGGAAGEDLAVGAFLRQQ
ncbi:hypothetical protein ACQ86N_32275 [Puia sp. P3]|uniref:hypothetical protein n=1 Tax=Puia sp. P3 TaxID=3423952 RepID=UPI003D674241